MNPPNLTDDIFISADQPWPGLAAFPESACDFFHGRAKATQALTRLVGTSHAAVLFGQSGLGKTSLIRAGLFPELRRDEFLPVYVRLDHAESAPPLARQIITALQQECTARGVDCPASLPDDSLWTWLHRQGADFWADGIQLLTPVLVLDQFEELFTLGNQNEANRVRAAAFLDDLAGLVENRPPTAIRQRIEADPAAGREFDFARASFRLLISLREDFLPDFESLMPQLPSLRLNRMRLLPMSGAEALQVVADGGGTLVDAAVAERIVRFVAADRQDKTHALSELAVEPSLLSLICRELNLRRQNQHLPQISADLLTGARDEILTDFYTRCLADQPPAAITLVEEHLLSESGYRNSLALDDALRMPQIERAVIDTLVARRLLRLEERSGILRVELTHDLLTSVARERRSQRRQAEALAAAQREAVANQRKMRRMMALAGGMFVMVLGMLGLGWLTLEKNQQMEQMTRVSLTRQLAVQANEILSDSKQAVRPWTLGVLLAMEARNLSPDIAGLAPLVKARTQTEHYLLGEPLRGHENSVISVAFSPDGKTLVSGSWDKTLRLWDVATRKPLGEPLRGHEDRVYSVAFSPDGKTLVSGSDDKTLRLWDVATRKPLGEPLRGHEDMVLSVTFSPDGKTLVSRSFDKTLRLWDVDFAAWPALLCKAIDRNLTRAEWQEFIGDFIPYRKTCPDLPGPTD